MNKREKVFRKTNGKCAYCGCDINFNNFHIDHLKPKSFLKQSKGDIDNLFPACVDCNLTKSNLSLEEFRNKIETEIFKKHVGRIIEKYYEIRHKKIEFYFEKHEGGD